MQKLTIKDLRYALPERKHCKGDKQMVSFRLPQDLLKELQSTADSFGWDKTEVMTTALDQFVQWAKKRKKD